jgi:Spy/CpxP family protein refolding chaperone
MRARRDELQRRMEATIKKDLNLTDDQAAKLHATHDKFEGQRRDLMKRGQGVREALRGQLQPGVAANTDSVKKLLDARQQIMASFAQLGRDMDRELATYLSPVQRARIELLHERMMARGRGMMRDGRHGGPGGRGDGPDGRRGRDWPDGDRGGLEPT